MLRYTRASPPTNMITICTTSVIITAVIPPKYVYRPTTPAVIKIDVQMDQPKSTFSSTALDQKSTPRSRAKNKIHVREASVRTDGLYRRPKYSGMVYIPPRQKYGINIKAARSMAGTEPTQSKFPT